jgi:hypothetical protein
MELIHKALVLALFIAAWCAATGVCNTFERKL